MIDSNLFSALLQHAQSCLQTTKLAQVHVGRCPRLAASPSVLSVLGSAGLEGPSGGSARKIHVSCSRERHLLLLPLVSDNVEVFPKSQH